MYRWVKLFLQHSFFLFIGIFDTETTDIDMLLHV